MVPLLQLRVAAAGIEWDGKEVQEPPLKNPLPRTINPKLSTLNLKS